MRHVRGWADVGRLRGESASPDVRLFVYPFCGLPRRQGSDAEFCIPISTSQTTKVVHKTPRPAAICAATRRRGVHKPALRGVGRPSAFPGGAGDALALRPLEPTAGEPGFTL